MVIGEWERCKNSFAGPFLIEFDWHLAQSYGRNPIPIESVISVGTNLLVLINQGTPLKLLLWNTSVALN